MTDIRWALLVVAVMIALMTAVTTAIAIGEAMGAQTCVVTGPASQTCRWEWR